MSSVQARRVDFGDYVPLAIFASVYVVTCLTGAVLLIVNYRPFVALWEYFSGTTAPALDQGQLLTSIELLVLPPIVLSAGYMVAQRIHLPRVDLRPTRALGVPSPSPALAQFVFYALALIGAISLARAGSFTRLDSWLSYQAWVDARWNAFATMSFFEFVNIYTFVPLAAAWCALSTRGGGIRGFVIRWIPAGIAILLTLALFQKKAALVAFVIVMSAVLIDLWRRRPSLLRRRAALGLLALVLAYFAMVVVPTFNLAVHDEPALQRTRASLLTPTPSAVARSTTTSVPTTAPTTVPTTVPTTRPTSVPTTVPSVAPNGVATSVPSSVPTTIPTTAPTSRPTIAPTTAPTLMPATPQTEVAANPPDPIVGILAYSFFAPLMRTSAPALYYSIVFPDAHAFYGPDLGLDIVCSRRIGCSGLRMPDDNLVVWDYMNPVLHGGSITAPYQFALYSQWGLPWALLGSAVLGVLLSLLWRFSRRPSTPIPWSNLMGATTIMLALNLALDSPRNSIVVSYGALWGLVFVAIAAAIPLAAGYIRSRPIASAPVRRTTQ